VDRAVVFQGDDALFPWLRAIDNVAATSIRPIGYRSGLLDPIGIGIAEIYR